MMNIPKMPEDFKGTYTTNGGFTSTNPRKWTAAEIEWCLKLKEQGFSAKDIADSIERSHVSVQIKLKRLTKKDDSYNQEHLIEKYETNRAFIEYLEPDTVLDAYCGVKSFYKSNATNLYLDATTNDKDKKIEADFHLDALKFLCLQYAEGNSYDLVDLDPYGSASDCFDLAIKMAKKGIAIPLGEIGHKRWKRLDYVKRHYDITSLEDLTTINLIEHIKKQALKHKKQLHVWSYHEWRNISRVWFEVEPLKITEQWESKDDA